MNPIKVVIKKELTKVYYYEYNLYFFGMKIYQYKITSDFPCDINIAKDKCETQEKVGFKN